MGTTANLDDGPTMAPDKEYITISKAEISEKVRLFADQYLTEQNIASWYKDQGMPADVLKAFYSSDLGKYGLLKELGGVETDMKTQVYIIEELHRAAGTILPIMPHILSLRILNTIRDDHQLDLIKRMIDTTGSTGFSEAITEPHAGSDVYAIKTVAKTVGDEIYLNGTKTFVINGYFAPYILVLAKDEDDARDNKSLSFWLIPRSLEGVSVYPLESIGQKMTPQAMIHFENVKLDPSYVLERRGIAGKAMMLCFDIGRTLLSASSLGLAEAAMDDAVRYASSRKSFGTTIADLPQIQEKLTDMEIAIRTMRSLVYDAADKHDAAMGFTDPEANLAFKLSATLAKRMVPKTATEVASEALQIMGGIGYTQMSRIGRIWNDCRGNQIAQGTDEIMVRVAGKRIVKAYQDGLL